MIAALALSLAVAAPRGEVGLRAQSWVQTSIFETSETRATASRVAWAPLGLDVGVVWRPEDDGPVTAVRVAAGLTTGPGTWPVAVEGATGWHWQLDRVSLDLQGQIGVVVPVDDPRHSHLRAGPALAVGSGRVHVVYAPAMTAPLARSRAGVLDGTLTERVAWHVTPMDLAVRVSFGR